jgi:hypothetical protein
LNDPLSARPPSVVVTSCYLISSVWSFFPILGLFQFLAKFFMGLTIGELFVVNLEPSIVKKFQFTFSKNFTSMFRITKGNFRLNFCNSNWISRTGKMSALKLKYFFLRTFLFCEKNSWRNLLLSLLHLVTLFCLLWIYELYSFEVKITIHSFNSFVQHFFWSFYKSHKVFLSGVEEQRRP